MARGVSMRRAVDCSDPEYFSPSGEFSSAHPHVYPHASTGFKHFLIRNCDVAVIEQLTTERIAAKIRASGRIRGKGRYYGSGHFSDLCEEC
jgi:hypothetical protein